MSVTGDSDSQESRPLWPLTIAELYQKLADGAMSDIEATGARVALRPQALAALRRERIAELVYFGLTDDEIKLEFLLDPELRVYLQTFQGTKKTTDTLAAEIRSERKRRETGGLEPKRQDFRRIILRQLRKVESQLDHVTPAGKRPLLDLAVSLARDIGRLDGVIHDSPGRAPQPVHPRGKPPVPGAATPTGDPAPIGDDDPLGMLADYEVDDDAPS